VVRIGETIRAYRGFGGQIRRKETIWKIYAPTATKYDILVHISLHLNWIRKTAINNMTVQKWESFSDKLSALRNAYKN
jgi:hypothetical protein